MFIKEARSHNHSANLSSNPLPTYDNDALNSTFSDLRLAVPFLAHHQEKLDKWFAQTFDPIMFGKTDFPV